MEVISIAGYTEVEKLYITKNHLLHKQIKENGLEKGNLQIRDEALLKLIRLYTREAGVRGLERQIATLCRKARSEEHTSELQSRGHLVCRLLLEKKNKNKIKK